MITVRRIEFKAYGGTGTLVGRCFLALLALNACDVAKDECKNDRCVIYRLDYDDQPPVGNMPNDATYFKKCIDDYIKLHNRGLHFLAPIMVEPSTIKLGDIRDCGYPDESIFSLKSLFCGKDRKDEIEELLSAAFTSGTPESELELSNKYGCYGDLAVNGFISERLIDTDAFAKKGEYTDVCNNPQDAIIFYAGSTDGGTANTMIDKDIRSLLHALVKSGKSVERDRVFKLYGLRTTPYSKFELQGNPADVAIVSSILRDKFEMSKGVLENILSQNALAKNDSIETYSYYDLNDGETKYWLDGLFLAGSETLDVTAWEALKDNQFHPTHFTEFALAMQAMDAIANRLPQLGQGVPCVYGYNDGGSHQTGPVTLQTFFQNSNVEYDYTVFTNDGITANGAVGLDKYVRAFILTLVSIKGQMISDFRNFNNAPPLYMEHIFNKAPGAMPGVCPLIADELERFLDEAKFIVMTMYDSMQYSKYGATVSPIRLMEEEIRYLYREDTLKNQITIPGGCGLSLNDDSTPPGWRVVELQANPYFSELDGMHEIHYTPAHGILAAHNQLRHERLYLNIGGTSDADSAYKIANNMIQRLFETYLAQM